MSPTAMRSGLWWIWGDDVMRVGVKKSTGDWCQLVALHAWSPRKISEKSGSGGEIARHPATSG